MKYYGLYVDGTNDFFTYSDKDGLYKVGDRVVVTFKGNNKSAIVVFEEKNEEYDFKVLPIKRHLKSQISFSKEMIALLRWIEKYYISSFHQVLNAAFPSNLRVEYIEEYRILKKDTRSLIEGVELQEYINERFKVSKQTLVKKFSSSVIKGAVSIGKLKGDKHLELTSFDLDGTYDELIRYYEGRLIVGKVTLHKKFGESLVAKFVKEDILKIEKRLKEESQGKSTRKDLEDIQSKEVELTSEQKRVSDGINNSSSKYFLLKGVTGSGKTEVYIDLIKKALLKGKGSIFLVPEISITPQMIKRFKSAFLSDVAILHSKMTQAEKSREWLSIYRGEKRVVVGVRSAIFAPIKDLEYVIIDEEHETTYKQDTNPRYNAKYVAIKRGELEGAKVILGSATPSIETYYQAKQGIFELYELNSRYKGAKLPTLRLVDMREEKNNFLSENLLKDISKNLRRGNQTMLLLNRKGYSTYIQCQDCGHVEECPHCSISMNYYMKEDVYKCNYCGYIKRYKKICSSCGSENISHSGRGTEKIEEELKEYFDTGIVRVDSESSREKDFFKRVYEDFLDNKYSIMLGTQMISKGLHFPNVTLVGVISADTILNFPDFRSGEKTFQLVQQVSGRAGRGEKDGEVLIQTFQPDNYVIKHILNSDYEGLYNEEIENRRILNYPPFSRIINIIISSQSEENLERYATKIKEIIDIDGVEVYGPMQAPIYRVNGRYRYQIFLKGNRKSIAKTKYIIKSIIENSKNTRYRVVADVDPINLM